MYKITIEYDDGMNIESALDKAKTAIVLADYESRTRCGCYIKMNGNAIFASVDDENGIDSFFLNA